MKFQVTPLLETGDAFALDTPNSRAVVDLLDRHKALLFQNENVDTPTTVEEFGQFVVDLQLDYYPYIGGAAPRRIIPVQAGQNIVFTANESPPEQPIPFHHELAQTPIPPNYIFFYCDVPSQQGGETPIIDSTKVYRFAQETHPEFLARLKHEGARYIRTLPAEDDPTSPIGRSYQNTWNVSTKEELEAKLNAIDGCTYEWKPDGSVRVTTEAVPAIRLVADHAQNLVFQQTFANSIVAAYLGWIDVRNPDPREALRFGASMEKMPEDVLQSIANFMQANRVLYPWKKGDIMALNNQLVMHSRNPFLGERKVYASIWGGPSAAVLQAQPANGVAVGVIPPTYFEPMKPTDPLVFGFWKVPKDKCADVCYQAIQAGYRRLDCACDYGNEVQVGEGIARALKDGLCQRSDLFVTSKLWNTYHHPDHVPLALQRTLSDLGVDYVDEYLIHFPISMQFVEFDKKYPPEWTNLDGKMVVVPNDMGATWKAMEALVDAGQTKTIGVCNFSTQLLRQLLSTSRIRPSALQVELHPQNSQSNLVRFAREAGMRVTSFSTLGASSYLELNMATNDEMLLTNTTICHLATAKNKSPAQILIRWALQRNTLPLTKTISPHRMSENRNVFDFYLTPSEMKQIDGLNQNRRYNDPGAFCEAGMGTYCPIYD